MSESVTIQIDGKPVAATTEDCVASVLLNAGIPALRQSVSAEPRGPVCGMGVCFECRVTIDGVPHARSCQATCHPGMDIQTRSSTHFVVSEKQLNKRAEHAFDVVVVGAGPGGIAAACVAAEAGRRVAIVDDNPRVGGQIWRRDPSKPTSGANAAWLTRLHQCSVEWFTHTQILGSLGSNSLLAESPSGPIALHWQHLILATGARERFVPFPGWTLPGVYGAGGLQALVKSGFAVVGRKIVVAGSGPLLLPVAAHLRKSGADVRLIAEQTSRGKLVRFTGSLIWHQPSKIAEAMSLGWQIRRIPYRTGVWPIRADGTDRLQSVTLTDGSRTWTEACDALACGFGLVANLELPILLGCVANRGFVTVDEHQRTNVPNVYAVGELTGIGGVDKALLEGQIAGLTASNQAERTDALRRQRDRYLHFVKLLDRAFSLRFELKGLADANAIVCRCEDVRLETLKKYASWRDAKLQTRCGMGPCQGRVCGPIVQDQFGWEPDSIRPPIFATTLGNLAQ